LQKAFSNGAVRAASYSMQSLESRCGLWLLSWVQLAAFGVALSFAGSATAAELESPPPAPREARPLSLGLRALFSPTLGIAGYGYGFDAAYSVLPELAVGAQHLRYKTDQGADPQYCQHCILDGSSTLAFAEGRLIPERWATPYARFGLGWSHLHGQRVAYDSEHREDRLTLLGEVGVELHYEWASLRAYGFDLLPVGTELDGDPFAGVGLQLGARL
jgi:hypothetical protein